GYLAEAFYKIANYELVHRDVAFIRKWSPEVIILDEAQRIKNWRTRTARSVKGLESPHALVLTGTPLENRLEELHSIVEFVDRFRLGPLFKFLDEHQVTEAEDGTGKVVGYRNLDRISRTLEPVLLRRSKQEVLDELPERLTKNHFVGMTREQIKHHEENRDIVARIAAKWRRYKFLSDADQRRLMIALQNMRMSCNSTYLLDEKTDFGFKVDELMRQIEDMFEEPETKAVVFSQWTRTHELIIRRLSTNGWGYTYLHGGVPGPQRKDLIHRFKTDPDCRLFLSTDAGGVGLNLQNASVVVNMDQPWNPAVLEQRIGRVHRLGQHRPVRVVNFIAQDTIEHGMLSLLDFKKSLFSGVLDGGQSEVFLGGPRLKRFMESVEKATSSIPETVPPVVEVPADHAEEVQDLASLSEERAAPAAGEAVWSDVASAGLEFIGKLGQALGLGSGAVQPSLTGLASTVLEKGPDGRTYLKLPVPQPETLRKLGDLFRELTGIK
ncbi:MAG: DEAD/DEAH box helicase, partial [Thermodesulfobacteriota bacterium]